MYGAIGAMAVVLLRIWQPESLWRENTVFRIASSRVTTLFIQSNIEKCSYLPRNCGDAHFDV